MLLLLLLWLLWLGELTRRLRSTVSGSGWGPTGHLVLITVGRAHRLACPRTLGYTSRHRGGDTAVWNRHGCSGTIWLSGLSLALRLTLTLRGPWTRTSRSRARTRTGEGASMLVPMRDVHPVALL